MYGQPVFSHFFSDNYLKPAMLSYLEKNSYLEKIPRDFLSLV